jgi:hypothetical protein
MARCEAAHAEFDRIAAGTIHVGTLPEWTSVRGKVAWTLSKGPYHQLPQAWAAFMREAPARDARGPSGDVYLCIPGDHAEERLLTILYLPVR